MQEFQLSGPRMFGLYHQATRAANIVRVHILQVKIFLNSTILIKTSLLVTLGAYILYKHNPFFSSEQSVSFLFVLRHESIVSVCYACIHPNFLSDLIS